MSRVRGGEACGVLDVFGRVLEGLAGVACGAEVFLGRGGPAEGCAAEGDVA